MKKSISILGIFLLMVSVSCRYEDGRLSPSDLQESSPAKALMKDSDSLPDSGNGETEPPRKDQLQWRNCP